MDDRSRQVLSVQSSPLWHAALATKIDEIACRSSLARQLKLMEEAGRQVASEAQLRFPETSVLVLAGSGNNGGDALVAARHLMAAGVSVQVILVAVDDENRFTPATRTQLDRLKQLPGISIEYFSAGCVKKHAGNTLIVDGVMGLGFSGMLRQGVALNALAEAHKCKGPVLAIDVPSGMAVDQGDGVPPPLPADVTVTFGAPKPAHVMAPSAKYCGEVVVYDLFSIDDIAIGLESEKVSFSVLKPPTPKLVELWQSLAPDAHKFQRGHVAIWGGSEGKCGAACLAGWGALRSGCGWATAICASEDFQEVSFRMPLSMTAEPLTDELDTAQWLEGFLYERKVAALVIGPGWAGQLLTRKHLYVIKDFVASGGRVVFDAGALHGLWPLLAECPLDPERAILLPHPGEWQRLGLNLPAPLSPSAVAELKACLKKVGCTAVYKGASPIVVSPDPEASALVLHSGSVMLAKAGMGDVLAGVTAVVATRGLVVSHAFALAYEFLCAAACKAAKDLGVESVLPMDVCERLGQ